VAHSKQFSNRPKEAILEELGSVKDLLNSFEDSIEDILARHPQPAADIPLLSDVVASATTAASDPLPPPAAAAAPGTSGQEPSANSEREPSANREREPSATSEREPSASREREPSATREREPSAPSEREPPATREHLPVGAPPPPAATGPDGGGGGGDSGAEEAPAAAGGSVIAVDLDHADVEELEQLVFSDDGPALAGASASAAPPAPRRQPGAAARTQRALEQLPHLVDDVIDAHIPRLRAELLARLRALIEFADEQQEQT
jgi:hypothetical protein